jgi:hypothetical protein
MLFYIQLIGAAAAEQTKENPMTDEQHPGITNSGIYIPKDNADAEAYARAMMRQVGYSDEQINDMLARRIK